MGIRPHTDGYGSPEQQAQREASVASDIYSLGATLYTLLTGQVPPKALSRETGLTDLLPAREANPNVEPYLSLVAGRAMSLRADARYETAVSFANALLSSFACVSKSLNALADSVKCRIRDVLKHIIDIIRGHSSLLIDSCSARYF